MSISQFILIGNWLLEGNIKQKFQCFFRNEAALALSSVFLLHIIGLIYTTDFDYALKDLRIKLPLIIFPLILSTTKPIERKQFHQLMLIFVAAVLAGTFASVYKLIQQDFNDIRKISPFISHIRFSLNICIAIYTLVFFIYSKNLFNAGLKIIFISVAIWLTFFLFILESIIGIIILIAIGLILILYNIFKIKNIYLKLNYILILFFVPALFYMYIHDIVKELKTPQTVDLNQIDQYTSLGNPYVHDTIKFPVEDGKYVGLYICYDELREAWNKRSSFDFDEKDEKNQYIKHTLIRFLSSKDFRKDAEGVNQLTDKDVKFIERGIANINYIKNPNIKTRISKILLGYNNFKEFKDPNRSSVIQRIEYWKASLGIIKNNLLFGVGTGDLNIAFKDYYEKVNSALKTEWRRRSHNQYLHIFVGLGLIGFLWFIFSLFYPPFITGKMFDYFYFIFFATAILSMFTEDTIESQAGVTFFAFFNSFFLFSRK
ncbi:MAG: O-antigen ligase family protein [Bacteroidales bacterium]|nr:O-antigen ligase family protein [Bacteroidales bacterium]